MNGLELSREFYEQVVAPRLGGVSHAAALLGDGSEVLGLDDDVSTDHDFGERVQVFTADDDGVARVRRLLDGGRDRVEVATPSAFFGAHLGWDPAAGVRLTDWLTTPTQRLATMTGGAVFHDPGDLLTTRRETLRWYPDDVWRYVLAAAWLRVSQEEAFVGRTGARGDDLGSAMVAARVGRDLARLAFLIERRWAPYSKWLGTAFWRLPCAATVGPQLSAALRATGWRDREAVLVAAGRELAVATNGLGLAAEVDPEPRQFYDRDIRVIGGERFTRALLEPITDAEVRSLVDRSGVRTHDGVPMLTGAIDQAVDSVDVVTYVDRCRSAAPMLGLPNDG